MACFLPAQSYVKGWVDIEDQSCIPVPSDGHDKPFCTAAVTIIDNFKKALGDTDNR